jgi:hypothetical protein
MAFTSEGYEMTPTFVWPGSYLNALRLKRLSMPGQRFIKS